MKIINKWSVGSFVLILLALLLMCMDEYPSFDRPEPLSKEKMGAIDSMNGAPFLKNQAPQSTRCLAGQEVAMEHECQPEVTAKLEAPFPKKAPSDTMGLPAQLQLASKCRDVSAAEIEKSGVDCRREIQAASNAIQQLEARVVQGDARSASELGNELRRNISIHPNTEEARKYKDSLRHAEAVLYQAAVSGDKAAAMAYSSKDRAPVD